ncbi:MAG: hypothetical protein ACODAB_04010 [Gemmatimonadota bacterium]
MNLTRAGFVLSILLLLGCGDGDVADEPPAEDAAATEVREGETLTEEPVSGFVHGLRPGQWTGRMVPPEGVGVDVTFNVSEIADRPSINMAVPGVGMKPLSDVDAGDGTIAFTFDMNGDVRCDLEHQPDGSYAGECESEQGAGSITMVPPEE